MRRDSGSWGSLEGVAGTQPQDTPLHSRPLPALPLCFPAWWQTPHAQLLLASLVPQTGKLLLELEGTLWGFR